MLIEDKIEKIASVTKEDIIRAAKKIKENRFIFFVGIGLLISTIIALLLYLFC